MKKITIVFLLLFFIKAEAQTGSTDNFMQGRKYFGSLVFSPFHKDYMASNVNISVGGMVSPKLALAFDYYIIGASSKDMYLEGNISNTELQSGSFSFGVFARYYAFKGLYGALGSKYHTNFQQHYSTITNTSLLLDKNGNPVQDENGNIVYTPQNKKIKYELISESLEYYIGVGYTQRLIDGFAIDIMPKLSILSGKRDQVIKEKNNGSNGDMEYFYHIQDDVSFTEMIMGCQFRLMYFF
ncbi:MAG: hypothetical protein N4A45_02910 [Flavobacteriales bacterium]|nr:hypothetical protein [Flavobacteriales bacterium]